ncbi:FAD:protein FMN transferase [Roseibacillus persicicus]|uniref:FAD:protein FMN transferase n=1 Tax=Roseibacillus persicicus TaxID=454148 RepID=UPI001674C8E1|nr:FAD:protein FMN transferase [Roseibacillus persicicus]
MAGSMGSREDGLKFLLLAVFAALLLSCRPSQSEAELSVAQGSAMGTSWRLVVRGGDAPEWQSEIESLLLTQEKRFSNWSEVSEVSRIERGESEMSSEMRDLLTLSEQIREASDGAFDIAWDGGLDLGGVAKGWAVDRVGELLGEVGLSDFVFELGGEIIARGDGPDGEGWQVGVESPDPTSADLARTLTLHNECLATSGNYHQPGHLKDGRTGQQVGGEFRSVTVVMPTCAEADAWATALFVLGDEPSGFAGRAYRNR